MTSGGRTTPPPEPAHGGLGTATKTILPGGKSLRLPVRPVLVVVDGPDKGRRFDLRPGVAVLGNSPEADLKLSDDHVSRRHLELTIDEDLRVTARDLGSKNGCFYLGARFENLDLELGATITIGRTSLALASGEQAEKLSEAPERFGGLIGRSPAMRKVFELLGKLAQSDVSVLIMAETGCGKELAARAIHDRSPRRDGPFVVCDMSALPDTLIEGQIFGHVRGSFTGADRDRVGILAEADGGTLFLDEIGELPIELQPRLLRVLESGQVRRIGETEYRKIDVRVVAATNRQLGAEITAGRFRADLYHRLAVAELGIPPLRDRPSDIEMLVEELMGQAAEGGGVAPTLAPGTMSALCSYSWPGNVRQLRNVLARAAALAEGGIIDHHVLGLPSEAEAPDSAMPALDVEAPLDQARDRLLERWERAYVLAQIEQAGGNVTAAARRAGIHRTHFYRLMRKYSIER